MNYTKEQIVQIAKAHTSFLLCFGACILCQVLVAAGLSFAALVLLIPAIFMIVFLAKMLSAMNYNVAIIILLCIATILPVIGIITLLILNGNVTNVLKSVGLSVGLFGVSSADLERWKKQ